MEVLEAAGKFMAVSADIALFARLCKELLRYEDAGVRRENKEARRAGKKARKAWARILEEQLCPACLGQNPGWENSTDEMRKMIEAYNKGEHIHHRVLE